jgi:hypothetical protein
MWRSTGLSIQRKRTNLPLINKVFQANDLSSLFSDECRDTSRNSSHGSTRPREFVVTAFEARMRHTPNASPENNTATTLC